jgi:hypothetical protein
MTTSETSTRKSMESFYKRRKPAKWTWPVGGGPTLKKIPKFPNYEQPFALTDEQIRELRSRSQEDQHENSGHYYEEEVGSNNPVWDSEEKKTKSEEKTEFEKETKSDDETKSEEESDTDDPDWNPKEKFPVKKKK